MVVVMDTHAKMIVNDWIRIFRVEFSMRYDDGELVEFSLVW